MYINFIFHKVSLENINLFLDILIKISVLIAIIYIASKYSEIKNINGQISVLMEEKEKLRNNISTYPEIYNINPYNSYQNKENIINEEYMKQIEMLDLKINSLREKRDSITFIPKLFKN